MALCPASGCKEDYGIATVSGFGRGAKGDLQAISNCRNN
jgi:hypothetical protein